MTTTMTTSLPRANAAYLQRQRSEEPAPALAVERRPRRNTFSSAKRVYLNLLPSRKENPPPPTRPRLRSGHRDLDQVHIAAYPMAATLTWMQNWVLQTLV